LNYDDDAKRFSSMMNITWQSCGRNQPEKETKAYWFNKLEKYEFKEVENAFDEWLKSQDELPTIHQIIKLCQHKVTIYAQLASPLAMADNKRHAQEVVDFVANNITKKTDYRAWAKKIIDNPKNYPDISLKYANEAIAAKYH
jgi:hypothetical protein